MSSDQLRRNVASGQYYLILDLAHLQAFDETLATTLLRRPSDIGNFVRPPASGRRPTDRV